MPNFKYVRLILVVSLTFLVLNTDASAADDDAAQPNILWIVVEDMSAHFSCYGETTIETPNVDRLAAEGVQFNNAFITAPVCSAARSALITGMYQTSIGAHQHRSGRGIEKIHLPKNVELVSAMFKKAGYYTVNASMQNRGDRIAKTDYNFEWSESAYDGNDWSKRKVGQPFFAQIQLKGGKLRGDGGNGWSAKAKEALGSNTPESQVELPPYYPNDPVIVKDWAMYLDAVRYTDMEVGKIMQRLKDEGIADSTYVFFITDHGISHARGKQFLYEEGVHIPFIVRGPQIKAGSTRDDLIVHIDMAATSLALAGIDVPDWMQSQDVLAKEYQPRDYVVCARDRCDETVERLRAVRTNTFKYIRNYYPQRPYLQPNAYKDGKAILIALRAAHAAGELNAAQSLILAETRPKEELYDLESDPHELKNLAADPAHQKTLKLLRRHLATWIKELGDLGETPESEKMYDSDMATYLQALRNRNHKNLAPVQRNIRQMKEWAAAGK